MSKAAVCPNCGGSDIDNDPSRGNAVCVGCGSVIEDNFIVSEVTFSENSMGGTSVIGQFVSSEGGKSSSLGGTFRPGLGKESRLLTLQKGKKRIYHIGNQLNLNSHCLDIAYNFFKMAVQKKLTRGRRTDHVVAACLYMVCRLESTPHMLLDFSDLLQVNVYFLGRTFVKLSQELHINIPAIDPCLYIPRFAHKLEFGDKTHTVCMTALRLVSRMKRDWMHTGRRPSGLCGAALLVSARLHNFNRTQKQIIKVVKVCDGTLRKRLTEFEETPSGQLTIDEFNNIDLEEEQDPPAFTSARKKAKMNQLEELSKKNISDLEGEVSTVQYAIEKALNTRCKLLDDSGSVSSLSCVDEAERDLSLADIDVDGSLSSVIKEVTAEDGDRDTAEPSDSLNRRTHHEQPIEKDQPIITSHGGSDQRKETDTQASGISDRSFNAFQESNVDKTSSQNAVLAKLSEEEEEEEVISSITQSRDLDQLLMPPPWVDRTKQQGLRPSPLSLGLKETIDECMRVPENKEAETAEDETGELDLQGIDDSELDRFILSKEEVELKTRLWDAENGEFYAKLLAKREAEEKQREENQAKQDQKKKKRTRKNPRQASTAGEAIEKLLQEKKISSKINYDVLKNLEKSSSISAVPPTSPLPQINSVTNKPPRVMSATREPDNKELAIKRLSDDVIVKEEAPKKKVKMEVPDAVPLVGVQGPDHAADVVIESGPVEGHVEDDDDYFHDEEEDEQEWLDDGDDMDDYNDGYD